MKVLSYLQACNEGGFVDIALYLDKAAMSDSVTEFYSQPFKPELITELFEGWTFQYVRTISGIKTSGKRYRHLGYEIEVTFHDGSRYYDIAQGVDDIADFFYPRTLDDFINDVTRAGIELKWRVDEN